MFDTCDPTRDGYIHWIYVIFGDCVYGKQEATSVLLGYASIFCWLNAQLPQIIENYKIGSADSLSLSFLMNWLLGDITNLGGAIILDQLPFQIYLAWYFCIVDFTLLGQYIYYTRRATVIEEPIMQPLLPREIYSNTFPMRKKGDRAHRQSTSIIFLAVLILTLNQSSSTPILTSPSLQSYGKRSLPDWDSGDIPWPEISSKMIGRILAWTCTILYLTSRMPQIFKNWSRASVEGLSISMFIFAALGNLTYSMSIVSNPTNNTSKALHEALPYLIGSSGTLCFDCTIFLQWVYYGRLERWRQRQLIEIESDEERQREV